MIQHEPVLTGVTNLQLLCFIGKHYVDRYEQNHNCKSGKYRSTKDLPKKVESQNYLEGTCNKHQQAVVIQTYIDIIFILLSRDSDSGIIVTTNLPPLRSD